MAVKFKDDNAGYRDWLRSHPHGTVLNTTRTPTAAYLILHKADCRTIQPHGGRNWTRDYIKICADSPEDIERWVRNEVGGEITTCSHCHS